MVCYMTCSISLVFLFSMIYMVLMVDTKGLTRNLLSKLTPGETEKYMLIVSERKRLYLHGFALGFIISMIALYLMKSNTKMTSTVMLCSTVVISYTVMYFYYTLSAKQDLLVVHLDNYEARMAWMEYYKTMKNSYHMSMILGVIFVALFSHSLC